MKVLVTGATGRIGRVVVDDLLDRGYSVRATSSKDLSGTGTHGPALEWRRVDFLKASDCNKLVAGCDAVLHLAAEIHNSGRMWRLNVDATRLLAESAERANIKAFCYASSVAVYGSGAQRTMTENSPVLTVDRDIRSEYCVADYVRVYGRTKLAGELALQQIAKGVRYVAMRPTVVVDTPDIIAIRNWSTMKRMLAAHRHAHHIYVRDVSDALIWGIKRSIAGVQAPGTVDIFNLSEDEFEEATHADFMCKAFAASGDPRFNVVRVPAFFDRLQDFARYRTLPLRNPLWRMRFPNDRLRAAGYCLPFGMGRAHALAIDALKSESRGLSPLKHAGSLRDVKPPGIR